MGTVERAIKKLQGSGQRPSTSDIAAAIEAPAAVAGVAQEAFEPRRKLSLSRSQLAAAGLVAPRQHEALMAEQFRAIKRPLIATALGKSPGELRAANLVMMTSALPGEGKTFCSYNLAVSMAQERDHQVILVDADVIKPRLSDALGASAEPGLLDLLADDGLRLADVLLGTESDALLFCPSGAPRENAHELLASERMEAIWSRLTALRHSIVIFDSPPLLAANEARVLLGLVGQVVMVVAASSTAQADVLEAVSLIDEEKALNLVLNRATTRADLTYVAASYGQS